MRFEIFAGQNSCNSIRYESRESMSVNFKREGEQIQLAFVLLPMKGPAQKNIDFTFCIFSIS